MKYAFEFTGGNKSMGAGVHWNSGFSGLRSIKSTVSNKNEVCPMKSSFEFMAGIKS